MALSSRVAAPLLFQIAGTFGIAPDNSHAPVNPDGTLLRLIQN